MGAGCFGGYFYGKSKNLDTSKPWALRFTVVINPEHLLIGPVNELGARSIRIRTLAASLRRPCA